MRKLEEIKIRVNSKLVKRNEALVTTAYDAADRDFFVWWVDEMAKRLTASKRLAFRKKLIELLGEKRWE